MFMNVVIRLRRGRLVMMMRKSVRGGRREIGEWAYEAVCGAEDEVYGEEASYVYNFPNERFFEGSGFLLMWLDWAGQTWRYASCILIFDGGRFGRMLVGWLGR